MASATDAHWMYLRDPETGEVLWSVDEPVEGPIHVGPEDASLRPGHSYTLVWPGGNPAWQKPT